MIERGGVLVLEHFAHSGHVADIPCAQILVEHGGVVKHRGHIGHLADIPAADWLVERACAVEHPAYISHGADLPVAQILIERPGVLEHSRHIGHITDIPMAEWLVDDGGAKEHPPHTRHRPQIGSSGTRFYDEVGAAGKTVLHTAPGNGAPLLDGENSGSVAAAVEVNLREVAGNSDRIGAGRGVGMPGVAGFVVLGEGGTVSPVHRVIIGASGAADRYGDGLVGRSGAPGGDERIRVKCGRGRGQDVVPTEVGGGGERDVGGGRAGPDGHSDIGVLYTIGQAGDFTHESIFADCTPLVRDLNQVRLYRMPAPLCYPIPQHRDTAVAGDRAHVGWCDWSPGTDREHELCVGIRGGGIAIVSDDGDGSRRLSKCGGWRRAAQCAGVRVDAQPVGPGNAVGQRIHIEVVEGVCREGVTERYQCGLGPVGNRIPHQRRLRTGRQQRDDR